MVLPLYDDGPTARSVPPYATYALIAANVLVFFYRLSLDAYGSIAFEITYGMSPAAMTHHHFLVPSFPPLVTLVTYQFLHLNIVHLIGNMIFLWVFGDNIEDTMGAMRFTAFYLLCGVAAGLAHVAVDPRSIAPLIGASGAVSGVVAAYLMVRPCARIVVLLFVATASIPAYWVVAAFVLIQLYHIGFANHPNVAYWAHLGGLAAGAALLPLMRRPHVRLFECIRFPS